VRLDGEAGAAGIVAHGSWGDCGRCPCIREGLAAGAPVYRCAQDVRR
jgi:hypothetical protein